MAVALPATRAELDALKANLGAGYGAAATQVRNRAPEIQAVYDEIAAQIRGDAAKRQTADQETARQQDAGMASAAQSLGIAPVSLPNSRARSLSGALRDQYNGDAAGWSGYLGTMKGTAVGRNEAAAQMFDEGGRVVQGQLEREFAEYMAGLAGRGGGGGGGGGGRGGSGNYWEDEPLVEYGDIAPMSEGVRKGLSATTNRETQRGGAYQKAGLLNPSGGWLGPRTATGAPSSGMSKSVLQKALANSKPKASTRRSGKGGTF